MRVAAVIGSAAVAAGAPLGCGNYSASAAWAWLQKQGCVDTKTNSCPGGLSPDAGCSDSAYIARALAAGGSVPLDANSPDRSTYQAFTYDGTLYNLEETEQLKKFLLTQGWAETGVAPADAAFGTIVFTTAYAHSPGGDGLPCFSQGSNFFNCHESPLLYGPQCGIDSSLFDTVSPKVWGCAGAPPAPQPPTPPPAPTPPKCDPAVCYPNSEYYVCRPKSGLSTGDLQSLLDYCCSEGTGVDCAAINQKGACYGVLNNTVQAHADWCLKTYYRVQCSHCIVPVTKRCDFGGKAELVKGPLPCPH